MREGWQPPKPAKVGRASRCPALALGSTAYARTEITWRLGRERGGVKGNREGRGDTGKGEEEGRGRIGRERERRRV